jgi:hypothetical protein
MEDHELIKWISDDQTDMKDKFMRMNDQGRTQELRSLSSWLHDGSNLRKKAQIMKLGQELNRLHQAMRKIGR